MHGDNFWPLLIRSLMTEKGISERELCRMSGMHRATFRKAMAGMKPFKVDELEFMLTMFGYELEAIRTEAA